MELIHYGYLNLSLTDAQDIPFVKDRGITKVSTCTSGTASKTKRSGLHVKATDW